MCLFLGISVILSIVMTVAAVVFYIKLCQQYKDIGYFCYQIALHPAQLIKARSDGYNHGYASGQSEILEELVEHVDLVYVPGEDPPWPSESPDSYPETTGWDV